MAIAFGGQTAVCLPIRKWAMIKRRRVADMTRKSILKGHFLRCGPHAGPFNIFENVRDSVKRYGSAW